MTWITALTMILTTGAISRAVPAATSGIPENHVFLRLPAPLHLTERHALVGGVLAWHSEEPLADDVPGYLRAAAAERAALAGQEAHPDGGSPGVAGSDITASGPASSKAISARRVPASPLKRRATELAAGGKCPARMAVPTWSASQDAILSRPWYSATSSRAAGSPARPARRARPIRSRAEVIRSPPGCRPL